MDEITTGELSRRMDAFERHFDNRFDRLTHQINSLQFVTKAEYTLQIKVLEDRIEDLEEAKTWLSRALVLAVLTSIIIPALLLLLGLPV